MIGGSNIFFAQSNRANEKLRMAKEEIEHLAKVAERERIARDLHDVLGHTLSIIILKSELAGKLIDREPERAKAEIADVERTSREALVGGTQHHPWLSQVTAWKRNSNTPSPRSKRREWHCRQSPWNCR